MFCEVALNKTNGSIISGAFPPVNIIVVVISVKIGISVKRRPNFYGKPDF